MSCRTTRESLDAYIDAELPADRAAAVAEHLTACASCSSEYESMLNTIKALRTRLGRYSAPDVLRARVRSAVVGAAAAPAEANAPVRARRTTWHGASRASLAATAAVLVIGVALGSGLTLVARNDASDRTIPVAQQVLTSHIRSLMPDHFTDVRSNDQHNVKPWFNGRVDLSPVVPRLDDQGFPLIGGRVDYIDGRSVGVVVYGRRQHVINSFSWPSRSAGSAPISETAANGYTMLSWRRNGVERWVVSDLNATELRSFSSLLQAAGG